MGEFSESPFHSTAVCAAPVPRRESVDRLPGPYDFMNSIVSRPSLSASVISGEFGGFRSIERMYLHAGICEMKTLRTDIHRFHPDA
jgi:hypothetical protein